MPGDKDVDSILANLAPTVAPTEYVSCSFSAARYGDLVHLNPIASFCETEGLTVVVPRSAADANRILYESVFRCITLNAHSSLDAVGLTAVVANKLADGGISANVIAAFHHDHVFVQSEKAERASVLLASLRGQADDLPFPDEGNDHYRAFVDKGP